MLGPLGIEPEVEAVYRRLLGEPGATAVDLADALGRPAGEVSAALATLTGYGLATMTGDVAVAAPPAVALGALITEHRDGLRLAEQALATLAEEHRAAAAGRDIDELIEVVTGVDAIRHRFQQVQQAATSELRHFVTAPFVAVPPGANSAEAAATDRGVRLRVVVEQAVLSEPGAADETVESLGRGVEVRVAESLPMKLVLADADLALVPLAVGTGVEPGAVLLHRSGLLAALDALFELVWRQAFPLELAEPDDGTAHLVDAGQDEPTALDRKILSLLLAGLSDQAVSSQLDISLRTVQRRVRHLQDLAGVKTRMQLGWYAGRHNWA